MVDPEFDQPELPPTKGAQGSAVDVGHVSCAEEWLRRPARITRNIDHIRALSAIFRAKRPSIKLRVGHGFAPSPGAQKRLPPHGSFPRLGVVWALGRDAVAPQPSAGHARPPPLSEPGRRRLWGLGSLLRVGVDGSPWEATGRGAPFISIGGGVAPERPNIRSEGRPYRMRKGVIL